MDLQIIELIRNMTNETHTGDSMKEGFLIDMDGVIYRGSEPIPGAAEFIHYLQDAALPTCS